MPCLRLAVLSVVLLLWSAPAAAVTAAIVRPPAISAAISQALVRLHGELLSVGLEVAMADGPPAREVGTDASRAWLAALAAQHGASAVIDIVGEAVAVDVWIIDPASGSFQVTRVAVEPGPRNPSEQLAIRAIEVLRSSFLELDLEARARRDKPGETPPAADVVTARPPASHSERLGLAVGVAALRGLDGVGTALMPLVGIDWAPRPWLIAQATVAGLGSRPTVATLAGSARVAQYYGALSGGYRFRSGQRVRPFVAISAGALRTSVTGQADLPKHGHSAQQWSFLLGGSLGAAIRLQGRWELSLALHAHVAEPYVAIHFEDEVVATSGRPNLLLTLTMGAWL